MSISFQDDTKTRSSARTTRRQALLRGLGLLAGGIATTTLLRSKACLDGETPEKLLGNPLSMEDQELLCHAEILLAVAETNPDIPKMDLVLTRIIAASLELFSSENDLLAARCLLVLAAQGDVPPEAKRLADSAPERSALRCVRDRLLEKEATK